MSKIILLKHAGHIIPKQMVELALKNHATFMGVSFPEKGVIIGDHFSDMPTPDELMESQEEQKDKLVAMFFGNKKTPYLAEDYQPFSLLEKGEDTLVAAYAEGDFDFPEHKESQFSGEHHMVEDFLRPEIQEMYANCGGELGKLMEKLQSDRFKKLVDRQSVNRGVVLIMLANGEVFKYEKGNEIGGVFNEFWASNKLGYSPVETKADEPVVQKSSTGFGKRRPIASTEPVVVNKVIETPKADTAVAEVPNHPTMIQPPKDLVKTGGTKLKEWYSSWAKGGLKAMEKGGLEWRSGPEVEANDRWIAKYATTYKPFKEGLEDLKETVKAVPPKPEDKRSLPQKVKDAISSLLKEDRVKAIIKDNEVLDPKKAEINKFPSFSEQQGIKFEDTLKYDFEIFELIGKKDITALALLCTELSSNLRTLIDTPSEEQVNTEVVNDKPVVAPPTSVPAVKSTGFGSRRRVAA